jgi:hypothetical protein
VVGALEQHLSAVKRIHDMEAAEIRPGPLPDLDMERIRRRLNAIAGRSST